MISSAATRHLSRLAEGTLVALSRLQIGLEKG